MDNLMLGKSQSKNPLTFDNVQWERIVRNLQQAVLQFANGSRAGMHEVGAMLRSDMQKTQPLEPQDTKALHDSWKVQDTSSGGDITTRKYGVNIGYGFVQPPFKGKSKQVGDYAIYVHEMVDAKNWTRKGSGPKWFEKALNRNRQEIFRIIVEAAKERDKFDKPMKPTT